MYRGRLSNITAGGVQREERDSIVVRFAGDSGDGMQTVGDQFSDSSVLEGYDISTFPDYPAEIRAPAGTLPGISGFQVHFVLFACRSFQASS